MDIAEPRKTTDDLSLRKRVLQLETQLKNADTVIKERDSKLELMSKEVTQLLKDKEESDSLI